VAPCCGRPRLSVKRSRLLRNREFLKLWAGQTVSVFGDQITVLALPFAAVLTLDASAFQMGLLTTLAWLPHLLFSLHVGVLIDQRGRRRATMIAADLGRAAVIASVPVAFLVDALTMPHLYVVAFLHGTLSVFFDLSWGTIFVSIVPRADIVEANTNLFQSRWLAHVAGPSIAGGLVQLLRAPFALAVDAVSYLGSAVFLARLRVIEPEPERDPSERLRTRLAAGMRFIFRNDTMRASLLAFSTSNFFNLMFSALFVLYATRELHVRPGELGLILGSAAVGGLIGAGVAPRLSRAIGVGPSLIVGTLLFSIPLMLVPAAGGSHRLVLALLFLGMFFSALGVMTMDVNGNAINAALSPDRLRARIGGAHRVVNYGVRPIGALLAGILGELIGLRPTLWIAVSGAALAVLWLVRSSVPSLRELPEQTG
jgi:MFS family permease